MVVLYPVPLVTDVNVADDLVGTDPGSKLDQLLTDSTISGISGVDGSRNCTASPFLGFCCCFGSHGWSPVDTVTMSANRNLATTRAK